LLDGQLTHTTANVTGRHVLENRKAAQAKVRGVGEQPVR
jgi:hypothetical protein